MSPCLGLGLQLVKGIFVSFPLSAAMDRFSQMFSGTAFWNGLQSQSSQPKTPDPFEAPWESQGYLARMGDAPLTKVPTLTPIEKSDLVVAALIRAGKTNTNPDIKQLPSGSLGLRDAMSKNFKVTGQNFDGKFKVIKTANPRTKPSVKWVPRKKKVPFPQSDEAAVLAQDQGAWNAAVAKWQALAQEAGPEHSDLAKTLVKQEGVSELKGNFETRCFEEIQKEEAKAIFEDQCSIKSTSTLNQRAGRVSMFIQWCTSVGRELFPLTVDLVYAYVKNCHEEKAPATMAVEVIKGLRLATHILELHNSTDIFQTARIQGCIKSSYQGKRLTEKATVLSRAR